MGSYFSCFKKNKKQEDNKKKLLFNHTDITSITNQINTNHDINKRIHSDQFINI